MKKILYLHGFGSSGASGTVELLRREFWDRVDAAHRATVVAPDIPLDPLVAMPMLEELAFDEMPDLVIGTSMGGFYAQQLHGFTRICVNPSFWLSRKYDVLYVGKHKFDGVTDDDRTLCHGLFGDEDTILSSETRPLFEQHYPGMSHVFPGGHRMNTEVVTHTLLPFIRELNVI